VHRGRVEDVPPGLERRKGRTVRKIRGGAR
jgi:hypothetical protein